MLNIILPLFLLGSLDLKMWQILIKKTILFKLYTISQLSQFEGSLFEKKKKPYKSHCGNNPKDAIETFINYIRTYYFYENLLKEFLDFAITR